MSEKLKTDSQKKHRKRRKREIKRELILRMAEQSFIEQGYHNTMVDQIALDAGYTKATLYNYFESKDDMFTAVLAKSYAQLYETLCLVLKKSKDSDKLRAIGEAYLTFVDRHPGQAGVIDSGRCVTIHRAIIEKEEAGKPLTESEQELNEQDAKLGRVMTEVITLTLRSSGVEGNIPPLQVIKVLSALTSTIREIIRRGKSGGQTDEEIREILSILFTIIEQGVKHYRQPSIRGEYK